MLFSWLTKPLAYAFSSGFGVSELEAELLEMLRVGRLLKWGVFEGSVP